VRESLFSHLACAHLTPLLLGSWRKRLDSDVKGESLRSEIRAFLLVLMNERDQATFNVRLQCAFLAAEDLNVQSLQTVFVSTFRSKAHKFIEYYINEYRDRAHRWSLAWRSFYHASVEANMVSETGFSLLKASQPPHCLLSTR